MNDGEGEGKDQPFFCFLSNFRAITRLETLATQAKKMPVDKQNELMSDLLFTVHQHGGDDVS